MNILFRINHFSTLPFLFLILFFSTEVFAQQAKQVKGIIQDEEGNPVYGATIFLSSDNDSTYTSSNQNGEFTFKEVQSHSFSLR